MFPLSATCVLYFSGILVYSLTDIQSNNHECERACLGPKAAFAHTTAGPQWLIISASEFVLAQLFAVIGVILTQCVRGLAVCR